MLFPWIQWEGHLPTPTRIDSTAARIAAFLELLKASGGITRTVEASQVTPKKVELITDVSPPNKTLLQGYQTKKKYQKVPKMRYWGLYQLIDIHFFQGLINYRAISFGITGDGSQWATTRLALLQQHLLQEAVLVRTRPTPDLPGPGMYGNQTSSTHKGTYISYM